MEPNGPCFAVGPRGYFSLEPTVSSQQTATLLGAINGFFDKRIVYDADGRRWQAKGIECGYRRTWWTLLLANTVYNPRITVTILWREPKAYDLQELKRAYSRAVDEDDDVLTQFVDAEQLQKKIGAARSFEELIDVYKWMETDHGDEDAS
jgi:hypothetical protein